MYAMLPVGQVQVPPHPFDFPALLPSFAQLGVQQLPP
jgi:hypothetical protein